MSTADVVPVLAVRGAGQEPPVLDLEPVADWYAGVSRGRWRPRFVRLPPATLSDGLTRYRAGGGILASGPGSRDLAAAVVASLAAADRAAVAAAGRRLLLVTPRGFRPHTWSVRPGRGALLGRRWLGRYAVLPEDTGCGVAAHELAHLLLGWPDLDPVSGRRCLMGAGARYGAPPPAVLLLRVGWRRALPLCRTTPMTSIDSGGDSVGVAGPLVAEWRAGRLLAWSGGDRPRLVLDLAANANDAALGLLAPALRQPAATA